jgi:hypothetical protein
MTEVTEVKGVKAMKRYILLAGVAGALALAPTAAFAGTDGDNNEDPFTFENHVETILFNASANVDATLLVGYVTLNGTIDPDSAASAITDAKQLLDDESVNFSDPGGHDQYGCDGGNCHNDDHHGSNPATVDNHAKSGKVTGSGNVGVNIAAGQYNMQQNSGNIAVSGDPASEADGGWAKADTTGFQSLTNTSYGPPSMIYSLDSHDNGVNYKDTNTAKAGDVDASGNVGVNVAAGAFNQQQNLMTLAVANNSVLSQSTAALWQTASCNTINIQDQTNKASSGDIAGAGNIGVNVAAGVGNQQQNSLTAAVSNSVPLSGTTTGM